MKYTIRQLLHSPGFTVMALLTLALGIGANTAIFTLINSVLLRPLPYPDPSRLVAIDQVFTMRNGGEFRSWSYPRFEDLRRFSNSFDSVAAFASVNVNLTGTQNPERLNGECVSAAYFRVLRVDAADGRTFLDEEDRTPGTHPVALISQRLWQRRFGGDRTVVGSTIHLNEMPFTVVGVLPEGFRGIAGTTDVWAPMMMAPAIYDNPRRLTNAGSYWHQVIGRLRPGVSVQQAVEATRAVDSEIQKAHPAPSAMKARTEVSSLLDAKIDPAIRRSLLVLFGAVGFVLLIACANLANLLLGRSMARRKEAAIRAALGASRARLVRHFLTESVILSVVGGLAGLLIAVWGVDLATSLKPGIARGFWTTYARAVDRDAAHLDAWVIAFNLGASVLTGILFGLIPALQASRLNVSSRLRLRRVSARGVLIVAEVALALVLLAGAGLMIGSFTNLLHTPVGFAADHVATLKIDLPRRHYNLSQSTQFYEQLLAKIAANPRVTAAAVANSLPVSGQMEGTVLGIERQEPSQSVAVHVVAPDYFQALRIPLRQGRLLASTDRAGSPHVVLINETAARSLFPGDNPIGKRVNMSGGWGEKDELAEVVGVVGDVKYEQIEQSIEMDVYACYLQQYPMGGAFVAVRTPGDPSAAYAVVRQAVGELDREVPLSDMLPMEARLDTAMSRMRFSASLLGVFAALAAFLAGIGIYGVVSYSVSARTREIGIRMALGARAGTVLRAVAMDGLLLAGIGVAVGLPLALASTRVLSTMLYGVKPGDPTTLALISVVLILIAMVATYVPARRAAKVDPMEALRHE